MLIPLCLTNKLCGVISNILLLTLISLLIQIFKTNSNRSNKKCQHYNTVFWTTACNRKYICSSWPLLVIYQPSWWMETRNQPPRGSIIAKQVLMISCYIFLGLNFEPQNVYNKLHVPKGCLRKVESVTSDFSKRTTYIDGQLTSTDNLHRPTTYIDRQLTSFVLMVIMLTSKCSIILIFIQPKPSDFLTVLNNMKWLNGKLF